MNSYDFHKNTSEAARTGYERQTPTGASFEAFRRFARTINSSLMEESRKLDQERKELAKTYATPVAKEKISVVESAFQNSVKGKQVELGRILDRLIDAKRNAIVKYTTQPPTDRQLRLIDAMSRRAGDISATEWSMLVSEMAGNYQASALVLQIAKENGKPYALPFDPDESLQKLSILNDQLKRVVEHIHEEPLTAGYESAEFLEDSPDGKIPSLCAEFDSISPSYTAESMVELTDPADLEERLLKARGTAFRKDRTLFNEVVTAHLDIKENGLNDDNLGRAEKLISLVSTLYGEE